MIGPGKYDAECTKIMQSTQAHTVIMIVIGGNRGHGFSGQSKDDRVMERMPEILHDMANQIEFDRKNRQ